MTLDEVIKELCAIRAAYRGAGDWQVCIPEGLATDNWTDFSEIAPAPEHDEVHLS